MKILYVSINKIGNPIDVIKYFSEMINYLKSKNCAVFLMSDGSKRIKKPYWIARSIDDSEDIQSREIYDLERLVKQNQHYIKAL